MAAAGEGLCENYLVLKPEDASVLDLLRILWSEDLDGRDFYSSSVAGELLVGFRQRWILLVSVFLQKVLIHLKKPMAAAGSAAEICLNLPPANGGCRRLFFNLLTGRLVRPKKSSEKFRSIVGNVDKRLDLDDANIERQHYGSLAMMASKLSYENQAFVQNVVTHHWQMKFLGFYSCWNDYQETKSTHAIVFQNKPVDHPTLIVVAFRGTPPFDADAWQTDVDISWHQFHGVGKIHNGFMKALGLQKQTGGWPKDLPTQLQTPHKSFAYYTIRQKLKTLISEHVDAKIILTGHSLGGALAVLFPGVLAMHEEVSLLQRIEGVYTFGQPRVGDEQFGEYMKAKMEIHDVKYYRYVYCNDIVPRLPYDDETFLFKHFGLCLYFNSSYNGQVLGEEPNKNYFPLHVIPMILNAVYELVRSFILPWKKGKEYKEGWLMKVFRVMALVAPGLTDHFPVDYVNVTRLGKLTSPVYPQELNHSLKQE